MLKPFRYFFFRVYSWKRPVEGDALAAFTALAATASVLFLQLLALVVVVRKVLNLSGEVAGDRATSRVVGMMVGLLILAGLYRAWIARDQYMTFAEEFCEETADERRVRTILIIIGALVSFVLPFALMIAFPNRPS